MKTVIALALAAIAAGVLYIAGLMRFEIFGGGIIDSLRRNYSGD